MERAAEWFVSRYDRTTTDEEKGLLVFGFDSKLLVSVTTCLLEGS